MRLCHAAREHACQRCDSQQCCQLATALPGGQCTCLCARSVSSGLWRPGSVPTPLQTAGRASPRVRARHGPSFPFRPALQYFTAAHSPASPPARTRASNHQRQACKGAPAAAMGKLADVLAHPDELVPLVSSACLQQHPARPGQLVIAAAAHPAAPRPDPHLRGHQARHQAARRPQAGLLL